MRANLDAMEKNLDHLAAFVEADAAFHKEIATSSGNQVLQELLQSIRSLLRIWVDRALTDEGHAAAALAEHRAIFDGPRIARCRSGHEGHGFPYDYSLAPPAGRLRRRAVSDRAADGH